MACQLAVHQEGALDVPVGAHQLLELLGGESVRQVGEAEQRVGGLQGDIDQASPDSAVMEGADGILSLVPVQQSHKGWRKGTLWRRRRGKDGPGRVRNRRTDADGRVTDKHKHTFKARQSKEAGRNLCKMEINRQKEKKGHEKQGNK